MARRVGRRFLGGPAVLALATLVALVLPPLALVFYLLLDVFYLWPRKDADKR